MLDTANLADIRHCNEFYPLAGVTTNPSIICAEKTEFWTLLESIREIIGNDKMMHVQVTRKNAEGIIEEAKLLKKRLGTLIFIFYVLRKPAGRKRNAKNNYQQGR
jgi:fructose-6-phosphate aldolase 2